VTTARQRDEYEGDSLGDRLQVGLLAVQLHAQRPTAGSDVGRSRRPPEGRPIIGREGTPWGLDGRPLEFGSTSRRWSWCVSCFPQCIRVLVDEDSATPTVARWLPAVLCALAEQGGVSLLGCLRRIPQRKLPARAAKGCSAVATTLLAMAPAAGRWLPGRECASVGRRTVSVEDDRDGAWSSGAGRTTGTCLKNAR
jgi:hypothetical protein